MFRRIVLLFVLIAVCFVPTFSFSAEAEDGNILLTREEACYMIMNFLGENRVASAKQGTPFLDTQDDLLLKAKGLGIVRGYKGNSFMPQNNVTTQQFLVMLKRGVDLYAPDVIYDNRKIKKFKDHNFIDEYEKYYINQLSSIGVFENEEFLNPKQFITKAKAFKYINQARNAVVSASRQKPGVMKGEKPKIILYHHIGYPMDSKCAYMYVSPEMFEAEVKYMTEEGYTFLFPEEIYYSQNTKKSVIITFDDGYADNYLKAMPILKKYNAKATMYMVSDYIGETGFCNKDQLFEMNNSGIFRIGSHTASHHLITKIPVKQVDMELKKSKEVIEEITGRTVTSFCYPGGDFNEDVKKAVQKYYKSAMAVQPVNNYDIYKLPRLNVVGGFGLNEFAKELEYTSGK